VGYLATAFVLIIIFVAFRLTTRMDRRDEQRKNRTAANTRAVNPEVLHFGVFVSIADVPVSLGSLT